MLKVNSKMISLFHGTDNPQQYKTSLCCLTRLFIQSKNFVYFSFVYKSLVVVIGYKFITNLTINTTKNVLTYFYIVLMYDNMINYETNTSFM